MKYKKAICYTDGCHYPQIDGTGSGLHILFFNPEDVKDAVQFPGAPELFTEDGFIKNSSYTGTISKDHTKILRFDGLLPLKTASAQYAELSAVAHLLEDSLVHEHLEPNGSIVIYTDSTYTVNTYMTWIDGWHKKNWTRDGVSPVKNLDVVLRLWELKCAYKKRGVTVHLKYIPGHKGFYGNEYVDALSKEAAKYAATIKVELENIGWVPLETTLESTQNDEVVAVVMKTRTKSDVKKEDIVPDITSAKLNYVFTNEGDLTVKLGDEEYFYQMCGDHADSSKSDDLAMCGKYIPDAMFAVAFAKKPWTKLHELADRHYQEAWAGKPVMRRYDSVVCIHSAHLKRKVFTDACRDGQLPYDEMEFAEYGNCWMFGKLLISRIQRPPLLSYRLLDIRSELVTQLSDIHDVVNGRKEDGTLTLTEITNKFFDKDDKPVKNFYRNVDTVFDIDVHHPCGKEKTNLRFSRGISLFDRSGINRIHKPGGKWFVYCKRHGDYTFKYGIAYIGLNDAVLFSAYYRNIRIVKDI